MKKSYTYHYYTYISLNAYLLQKGNNIMASSVNIGGTWKQLHKIWVNVAGTWRQVTKAHCNVGGAWRQWFTGAKGVYLYRKTTYDPVGQNVYLINDDNYTITGEQFALAPKASMMFLSSDEAFYNYRDPYGIGKFDISTGAQLSFIPITAPTTVDVTGASCGCSENYIYTKATNKFHPADYRIIVLQLDKSTLAQLSHFYASTGNGYVNQVTGSNGQLFCSNQQSNASPPWATLDLRDENSKVLIKQLYYQSASRERFSNMGCDKNYLYSRRAGDAHSNRLYRCSKYDRNTATLISNLLGMSDMALIEDGNVDGFKN